MTTWKLNTASWPWLCQTANYRDTSSIIQMDSTSIQWLYMIRLHIYIKCKRNKHSQLGLKCFVTECKPTTTCLQPSRHMARWLGRAVWQTVGCRIYTVLQNVWKGYQSVQYTESYKYNQYGQLWKKLSKIPLCTIINRHLLYPAPSSLKHSTTGSFFNLEYEITWNKWEGSFLFRGNKTSSTLKDIRKYMRC